MTSPDPEDVPVTEGFALAGGWLLFVVMLTGLVYVLLRRPR